jgi:hypothetical protein
VALRFTAAIRSLFFLTAAAAEGFKENAQNNLQSAPP